MPCRVWHPPLRPVDRLASRNHAVHARSMMATRLVSLLNRDRRRSSTVMRPSVRASRRARRTDVSLTPASAATAPIAKAQRPRFATSTATTASTACSASVNRAAIIGGSRPEAAQRRRRSIEASVRGRDPARLLGAPARSDGGVEGIGEIAIPCPAGRFAPRWGELCRASISPDSASASPSDRCPSPNAFHNADATAGNAARGAASACRRIS